MSPSSTTTHSLPGYSRDQDNLHDLFEEAQKMCLCILGSRDGLVVQKLEGSCGMAYMWPTALSLSLSLSLSPSLYLYIHK